MNFGCKSTLLERARIEQAAWTKVDCRDLYEAEREQLRKGT